MGTKMKSTGVKGIFDRDGTMIIDKLIHGVRLYENCGKVTLKFAEQVLNKQMTALLEGRYFPDKVRGSLTVRVALNTYWEDKLKYLKSAKDTKYLLSKIDEILGETPLRTLTIAHIEKYKRQRANEHRKIRFKVAGEWKTKEGVLISPRTIQAEIDQLNIALNWMKKNRHIHSNPILDYEKVVQRKPGKIMLDQGKESGDEWNRLQKVANDDLKPIIVTLYESSLRPGEVFLMRWVWIDFFKRVIRIPAEVEKTGDGRTVPISKVLLDLLCSIPQVSELVFPSPRTGRPRTSIKKSFDTAVKRAGLTGRGITPYALRRTRLTIWDAIDPAAAMSAGDHTQKKTHYEHYVEITDDRLLRLVGVA